ncbi:hypothetical protein VOLCADRAFT_99623 [Volvox carteri f. nagariensis]|uniref:Uncharacterized protein n=1 Tax=Volvox carteri f. nagariensis TaxID=3068 RepID=D8UI55_VOLCA|nr:uncharacterized protein VOLCADRAFT_99623 [Volvox carteri f. nagariensis]EFJ40584.1 hypothetical protein VOLCADRAFT_99623 [Volvox carteri f. nagariensis]|eukprot:XP_002958362.1 hypothetical protein VOLCADRAFT_99623 [Volvox carteri f. nagariensis]
MFVPVDNGPPTQLGTSGHSLPTACPTPLLASTPSAAATAAPGPPGHSGATAATVGQAAVPGNAGPLQAASEPSVARILHPAGGPKLKISLPQQQQQQQQGVAGAGAGPGSAQGAGPPHSSQPGCGGGSEAPGGGGQQAVAAAAGGDGGGGDGAEGSAAAVAAATVNGGSDCGAGAAAGAGPPGGPPGALSDTPTRKRAAVGPAGGGGGAAGGGDAASHVATGSAHGPSPSKRARGMSGGAFGVVKKEETTQSSTTGPVAAVGHSSCSSVPNAAAAPLPAPTPTGGAGGGAGGGGGGGVTHMPGGRCDVCRRLKKGRCGTSTSSLKCEYRRLNNLPYADPITGERVIPPGYLASSEEDDEAAAAAHPHPGPGGGGGGAGAHRGGHSAGGAAAGVPGGGHFTRGGAAAHAAAAAAAAAASSSPSLGDGDGGTVLGSMLGGGGAVKPVRTNSGRPGTKPGARAAAAREAAAAANGGAPLHRAGSHGGSRTPRAGSGAGAGAAGVGRASGSGGGTAKARQRAAAAAAAAAAGSGGGGAASDRVLAHHQQPLVLDPMDSGADLFLDPDEELALAAAAIFDSPPRDSAAAAATAAARLAEMDRNWVVSEQQNAERKQKLAEARSTKVKDSERLSAALRARQSNVEHARAMATRANELRQKLERARAQLAALKGGSDGSGGGGGGGGGLVMANGDHRSSQGGAAAAPATSAVGLGAVNGTVGAEAAAAAAAAGKGPSSSGSRLTAAAAAAASTMKGSSPAGCDASDFLVLEDGGTGTESGPAAAAAAATTTTMQSAGNSIAASSGLGISGGLGPGPGGVDGPTTAVGQGVQGHGTATGAGGGGSGSAVQNGPLGAVAPRHASASYGGAGNSSGAGGLTGADAGTRRASSLPQPLPPLPSQHAVKILDRQSSATMQLMLSQRPESLQQAVTEASSATVSSSGVGLAGGSTAAAAAAAATTTHGFVLGQQQQQQQHHHHNHHQQQQQQGLQAQHPVQYLPAAADQLHFNTIAVGVRPGPGALGLEALQGECFGLQQLHADLAVLLHIGPEPFTLQVHKGGARPLRLQRSCSLDPSAFKLLVGERGLRGVHRALPRTATGAAELPSQLPPFPDILEVPVITPPSRSGPGLEAQTGTERPGGSRPGRVRFWRQQTTQAMYDSEPPARGASKKSRLLPDSGTGLCGSAPAQPHEESAHAAVAPGFTKSPPSPSSPLPPPSPSSPLLLRLPVTPLVNSFRSIKGDSIDGSGYGAVRQSPLGLLLAKGQSLAAAAAAVPPPPPLLSSALASSAGRLYRCAAFPFLDQLLLIRLAAAAQPLPLPPAEASAAATSAAMPCAAEQGPGGLGGLRLQRCTTLGRYQYQHQQRQRNGFHSGGGFGSCVSGRDGRCSAGNSARRPYTSGGGGGRQSTPSSPLAVRSGNGGGGAVAAAVATASTAEVANAADTVGEDGGGGDGCAAARQGGGCRASGRSGGCGGHDCGDSGDGDEDDGENDDGNDDDDDDDDEQEDEKGQKQQEEDGDGGEAKLKKLLEVQAAAALGAAAAAPTAAAAAGAKVLAAGSGAVGAWSPSSGAPGRMKPNGAIEDGLAGLLLEPPFLGAGVTGTSHHANDAGSTNGAGCGTGSTGSTAAATAATINTAAARDDAVRVSLSDRSTGPPAATGTSQRQDRRAPVSGRSTPGSASLPLKETSSPALTREEVEAEVGVEASLLHAAECKGDSSCRAGLPPAFFPASPPTAAAAAAAPAAAAAQAAPSAAANGPLSVVTHAAAAAGLASQHQRPTRPVQSSPSPPAGVPPPPQPPPPWAPSPTRGSGGVGAPPAEVAIQLALSGEGDPRDPPDPGAEATATVTATVVTADDNCCDDTHKSSAAEQRQTRGNDVAVGAEGVEDGNDHAAGGGDCSICLGGSSYGGRSSAAGGVCMFAASTTDGGDQAVDEGAVRRLVRLLLQLAATPPGPYTVAAAERAVEEAVLFRQRHRSQDALIRALAVAQAHAQALQQQELILLGAAKEGEEEGEEEGEPQAGTGFQTDFLGGGRFGTVFGLAAVGLGEGRLDEDLKEIPAPHTSPPRLCRRVAAPNGDGGCGGGGAAAAVSVPATAATAEATAEPDAEFSGGIMDQITAKMLWRLAGEAVASAADPEQHCGRVRSPAAAATVAASGGGGGGGADSYGGGGGGCARDQHRFSHHSTIWEESSMHFDSLRNVADDALRQVRHVTKAAEPLGVSSALVTLAAEAAEARGSPPPPPPPQQQQQQALPPTATMRTATPSCRVSLRSPPKKEDAGFGGPAAAAVAAAATSDAVEADAGFKNQGAAAAAAATSERWASRRRCIDGTTGLHTPFCARDPSGSQEEDDAVAEEPSFGIAPPRTRFSAPETPSVTPALAGSQDRKGLGRRICGSVSGSFVFSHRSAGSDGGEFGTSYWRLRPSRLDVVISHGTEEIAAVAAAEAEAEASGDSAEISVGVRQCPFGEGPGPLGKSDDEGAREESGTDGNEEGRGVQSGGSGGGGSDVGDSSGDRGEGKTSSNTLSGSIAVDRYAALTAHSPSWKYTAMYDKHDAMLLARLASPLHRRNGHMTASCAGAESDAASTPSVRRRKGAAPLPMSMSLVAARPAPPASIAAAAAVTAGNPVPSAVSSSCSPYTADAADVTDDSQGESTHLRGRPSGPAEAMTVDSNRSVRRGGGTSASVTPSRGVRSSSGGGGGAASHLREYGGMLQGYAPAGVPYTLPPPPPSPLNTSDTIAALKGPLPRSTVAAAAAAAANVHSGVGLVAPTPDMSIRGRITVVTHGGGGGGAAAAAADREYRRSDAVLGISPPSVPVSGADRKRLREPPKVQSSFHGPIGHRPSTDSIAPGATGMVAPYRTTFVRHRDVTVSNGNHSSASSTSLYSEHGSVGVAAAVAASASDSVPRRRRPNGGQESTISWEETLQCLRYQTIHGLSYRPPPRGVAHRPPGPPKGPSALAAEGHAAGSNTDMPRNRKSAVRARSLTASKSRRLSSSSSVSRRNAAGTADAAAATIMGAAAATSATSGLPKLLSVLRHHRSNKMRPVACSMSPPSPSITPGPANRNAASRFSINAVLPYSGDDIGSSGRGIMPPPPKAASRSKGPRLGRSTAAAGAAATVTCVAADAAGAEATAGFRGTTACNVPASQTSKDVSLDPIQAFQLAAAGGEEQRRRSVGSGGGVGVGGVGGGEDDPQFRPSPGAAASTSTNLIAAAMHYASASSNDGLKPPPPPKPAPAPPSPKPPPPAAADGDRSRRSNMFVLDAARRGWRARLRSAMEQYWRTGSQRVLVPYGAPRLKKVKSTDGQVERWPYIWSPTRAGLQEDASAAAASAAVARSSTSSSSLKSRRSNSIRIGSATGGLTAALRSFRRSMQLKNRPTGSEPNLKEGTQGPLGTEAPSEGGGKEGGGGGGGGSARNGGADRPRLQSSASLRERWQQQWAPLANSIFSDNKVAHAPIT